MKNRIRDLRREHSVTAKHVGKKLGLNEASITSYERGDRDPSTDTLCKLADLFKCSIDYILYRTDIKSTYSYNNIIVNLESANRLVAQAMEKGLTIDQLDGILNIWIATNSK